MYYIEFMEKNPSVSQERFKEAVRSTEEGWQRDHPEDELVMMIGRTWRMGPRPGYMTIWKIKDFTTLKQWDEEFRKPKTLTEQEQQQQKEFNDVVTIVDAGVYEDLGCEIL
jgi:hypothetical protein